MWEYLVPLLVLIFAVEIRAISDNGRLLLNKARLLFSKGRLLKNKPCREEISSNKQSQSQSLSLKKGTIHVETYSYNHI